MGKEKRTMNIKVDLTKVVPAAHLKGENDEDTHLLTQMLTEATNYLSAFQWCKRIVESFFGIGVGGIMAVFLFRIKPSSEHVDEWMWVIVGDLPPAYITVDSAPNPACALDAYIGAMEEWVEAADSGRPVDNLIPVNIAPTSENARKLQRRLKFLDEEILSKYSADLVKPSGS
jgi:hypothetical protein